MIESAEAAIRFVRGLDEKAYFSDLHEITRAAVERKLEILGEAAGDVPDEVARLNPQIPWQALRRFRDVLAHRYFGIDDSVIWSTVSAELPPLVTGFRALLATAQDD